jgi:phage/plasmid primase-like uncharacterized protein
MGHYNSRVDFATVKAAADGRWPEILTYTGMPAEFFNGKHQPCYGCGGTDRARWDNQKQVFFCGQGGSVTGGDGFSLLEHCGWSKSSALHAVAQYLNLDRVMLSPEQRQEIRKRQQESERAKHEATLSHEMHVLLQVINPRIDGRTNAKNKNFRAARPQWSQPPDEHWQREIEAANTIHRIIEQLYKGAS